jgi:hypothetical protein
VGKLQGLYKAIYWALAELSDLHLHLHLHWYPGGMPGRASFKLANDEQIQLLRILGELRF